MYSHYLTFILFVNYYALKNILKSHEDLSKIKENKNYILKLK